MITRHVLRATVEGETLDAIQPGIITLVGFASGVLADGGAPGSGPSIPGTHSSVREIYVVCSTYM